MTNASTPRDLKKTPCTRAAELAGLRGVWRGVGSGQCLGLCAYTGHLGPAAQHRNKARTAFIHAAGELIRQDSLAQLIRGDYASAFSLTEAPATPSLAATP